MAAGFFMSCSAQLEKTLHVAHPLTEITPLVMEQASLQTH